jgi:hypothetical protein
VIYLSSEQSGEVISDLAIGVNYRACLTCRKVPARVERSEEMGDFTEITARSGTRNWSSEGIRNTRTFCLNGPLFFPGNYENIEKLELEFRIEDGRRFNGERHLFQRGLYQRTNNTGWNRETGVNRNKASLENSFNKRSNSGDAENLGTEEIKRVCSDQEQIQGSVRSSENTRRQEFRRDPLVELLRA